MIDNDFCKTLVCFTFGFLLIVSCQPEIDVQENTFRSGHAELTESGEIVHLLFDSQAGSASIDMNSNCSWTAEFVNNRASWCTFSKDHGKRGTTTLVISVEENSAYDERSASIIITHGDLKRTIVVTQKQKDALLLSSTRQDVGKDGGKIIVEISTNIPYDCTISEDAASWITPLGTKGLTASTLSFNVAANESFSKREGKITFSSSLGTEVMTVYQESDTPTLVVSRDSCFVSAEAGEFYVDIRSNVAISFEIPEDCHWVHELTTKAISTNRFHFSVEENEDFVVRYSKILFKCSEWNLEETVIVTQEKATPVIYIGEGEYEYEYEFEPEGGDLAIEVTSNFGIEVSIPDSCQWIRAINTKSLTTKTFYFTIATNETFDSREGVIIFSNDDLDKEEVVRIRQKAENPSLRIGEKEYEFSSEGGTLTVELSSNLTLDVVIQPGCDWITPVKTKTVTQRTHSFLVAKNHGRHERTGWIVFKNDKQSCTDTVYVMQHFQPILMHGDTLIASGRGWIVSFETTGSDPNDYRLYIADKWLSKAGQERSSEGSKFFISVEAQNEEAKPRDAQILVYYKDFTEPDTIYVHQYQLFPLFSFTTKAKNITLPEIEGENQLGFVSWGDDTQELWKSGLSHKYNTSGIHTITVEIRSKKRVPIIDLEDGMTINLRGLRN